MRKFISNYANIPDPITKFFNKINYVELDERDYSKQIEWLEAIKKVPLYVKCIELSSNNAEELEKLTDSNLHNTRMSSLKLNLENSIKISSKTIENLTAIYPYSITLSNIPSYRDETAYKILFENFAKLLSNFDQISLVLGTDYDDFDFRLEFNDVIFKVVDSNKECSYIKAKSVEIRCEDEEFCWIK